MAILDTVLMTKHPRLEHRSDEIFTINGDKHRLIITLHDTQSSKFIGQFGWDVFKGCVLYKNRVFLLEEDNSPGKLFSKTHKVRKFSAYTSNAFPIIDESLYAFWKFQLFDGKYVLTDIHPYQLIELIKED